MDKLSDKLDEINILIDNLQIEESKIKKEISDKVELIYNMINGIRKCKILCSDDSCLECYYNSFSYHPRAQYWSSKNELTPRQTYRGTTKKFLFDCDCGHEIEKSLNSITTNNQWCCFCANKRLCDDEQCKHCFERSFLSVFESKYLSDKNNINPRFINKESSEKFTFNCPDCLHEFENQPRHIKSGHWCGFCAGRKLCNSQDCLYCFNRSFASHYKSKYWSIKNKLTPREVFKSSAFLYLFNCRKCKHEFERGPGEIKRYQIWCPYCSHKRLCDDEQCQHCFENSFMSSDKAKYWSKKNKINPRSVFKSTSECYFFECGKCRYTFKSSPNSITRGTFCPKCKNKTEAVLYEFLSSMWKTKHQPKYEWCRSLEADRLLPFDFVIEKYKIIIELDGGQHFYQTSNWNSPEETNKRDIYKMKKANENEYSVIRLLQLDVYYDKNDWRANLEKSINTIINEEKIQNIYLCQNDEYKNMFKKMLTN